MLFKEREMSLALTKLFELFSPSDYEAFDEEEIGYAGGLCLPEVCMALKDAVQTVYQYSVTGGYEKSFDYRGVELFNQRGCLILSDVEQMVFDEAETTYATELWLLEDMSFAIVHCVKMKIGSEDTPMRTAISVRSGKPLKRMPKQRKGSCRLNMSRSPEPLFPLLLKPSMICWMSICQSMV